MALRFAALLLAVLSPAAALDLTKATVYSPPTFSQREKKAVSMLVEEVAKRSQIIWPRVEAKPSGSGAVISVTRATSGAAEGYSIRVQGQTVSVEGNDERGVLFGIGGLLRNLRMARQRIELAGDFQVSTAPKYPLRGHQLGYRPKTNSYDAWSLPMWEQYFRDLAVFGVNAVELLPPRTDDDADSPHFPLPPMVMMTGMSRVADEYGLDVWVWFPAMDKDYSDGATVAGSLKEWGEVFQKLPRVDAVFVPGGDPGHTQPKVLMALLEKQTQNLHRYHPKAQMWVSPQGFSQEWMEEFLGILRNQQPGWLSGVVFGPQVRGSMQQFLAAVPKKYPVRHYPDITHTLYCQLPVPEWDVAIAATVGREPVNPRPVDQARIFRLLQPGTIGFLTYSEGCNDDVNKIVWSGLGWDPERNVVDILREYSRYFLGAAHADALAQLLLALERNWRGPLLTNTGVETTLAQARELERSVAPPGLAQWRFQQALYRAYYDAYVRRRLLHETSLEQSAMEKLREAGRISASLALGQAESILDRSETQPVAGDVRARVFELAEALYQSIRMQLSVSRYKAIGMERGANLDAIDLPLNSRLWLKERFAALRGLGEAERLADIDKIVNWTNPGVGGFYDDLGNLTAQPHLVRGEGYEKDPMLLKTAQVGFAYRPAYRSSWWTHAEGLQENPVVLRYSNLDPAASYKVRVTYAGEVRPIEIRLEANGGIELHPYLQKTLPPEPLEFDIPREATRGGELMLRWNRKPGLGGNGRGNQVSEVWLIRK